MPYNGQLTQDAEEGMQVPSAVSAQRPSRCLGYGHISRSAKRVVKTASANRLGFRGIEDSLEL